MSALLLERLPSPVNMRALKNIKKSRLFAFFRKGEGLGGKVHAEVLSSTAFLLQRSKKSISEFKMETSEVISRVVEG